MVLYALANNKIIDPMAVIYLVSDYCRIMNDNLNKMTSQRYIKQ